jgi:hypothetical protein
MSTTLVPPSYYQVTPRDRPARQYPTAAKAAAAVLWYAPTPTAIAIVTGRRSRKLTDFELHRLRAEIRSLRLLERRRRERPSSDPGHALWPIADPVQ